MRLETILYENLLLTLFPPPQKKYACIQDDKIKMMRLAGMQNAWKKM
jgi:hypothetical protein